MVDDYLRKETKEFRKQEKAYTESDIITYGQDVVLTNCFVGRTWEIHDILNKLQKNNRLLICGMGGIGKTAILKKIFWDMQEQVRNDPTQKIGYFSYDVSIQKTISKALKFEKTDDPAIDAEKAKRLQTKINL